MRRAARATAAQHHADRLAGSRARAEKQRARCGSARRIIGRSPACGSGARNPAPGPRPRARVDVARSRQLFERNARIELPRLVQVLRHVAARQELPRERQVPRVYPAVQPDVAGAVGGERVVELGLAPERVDLVQVLPQQAPAVLRRAVQAVKVDIFRRILAVVRAQADDVALVGNYSRTARIAGRSRPGPNSSRSSPCASRSRPRMLPALEAEAENRVRDVRPHPVHGEEIHRL